MKRKFNAFTLAEVLISITIIGVIAMLTLPNVINNYQKKVYVTNVQKVYNVVSDAAQKYMTDNNSDSLEETDLTSIEGVGEFLNNYFKIIKDCNVISNKTKNICLIPSYKDVDGVSIYTPYFDERYCVILNTGAFVCMDTMRMLSPLSHGYSSVIFDINGVKPPNTKGLDLFSFELYSDGKISEGYEKQTKIEFCVSNAQDGGYAAGCFTKLRQNNWVMDY